MEPCLKCGGMSFSVELDYRGFKEYYCVQCGKCVYEIVEDIGDENPKYKRSARIARFFIEEQS